MTRLEFISSRFFKNWKTTVFGVVIYAGLTLIGYMDVVDWTTLSGYYVAATMFLFSEDPIKEREPSKPDP